MIDGLPLPQRIFAFLAVAIALTMSVLDGAIVNVALPTIQRDLGISSADVVWIVNVYQLAIIVSLLPLAALGDSIGYKRTYWAGLAVFTVASFACAQAQSFWFLSCARLVQGVGAAGVMSVNIALVRYIFPRAQIGTGIGLNAFVVGVSSAAGPSIASAILAVGNAQWQWLFLVNVPLGALALIIAARALPMTPASHRRFDFLSFLLNAVTFAALIDGLNSLSNWNDLRLSLVKLGVAFIAGFLFVRRELKLPQPMLPVDLLRLPVFSLSLMTSICSFAAQSMAYVALPFYLEETLGYSPTTTGLMLTPWPVMTAIMAPISGHMSNRFAPQWMGCLGMFLLACGLAAMAMLGPDPAPFAIGWRLALCGFGFGLFQTPNNRIIIQSAPRERSGGASGLQSTGRLLGQASGAAAVAIVFGLVQGHNTMLILWIAAGLSFFAACTGGLRKPEFQ